MPSAYALRSGLLGVERAAPVKTGAGSLALGAGANGRSSPESCLDPLSCTLAEMYTGRISQPGYQRPNKEVSLLGDPSQSLDGRRILVVEDEWIISEYLRE